MNLGSPRSGMMVFIVPRVKQSIWKGKFMVYKGKGVFRKVLVVWNKIWKVLG